MTSSAGGIQLTALDPAGYRHMPWKNGGGVTIDIAASMLPGFAPGSWEGIIWRFSRTAIVTPGAFSDLSGYDRQLVLVSGQGLVLGTPVGEIDVRQPFRPVRFTGETSIVSRLEAGPVEVVNLIGDRSRVAIDLCCLLGDATHACPAGVHIIYAATGSCELSIDDKAREISAGHAMRIDAGESFAVANRLGTAIVASVIPVARTSG
ncbi:HutD family protein [Bradyrhizobium sp. AUGA SZCCT0169]|uniref:HutD/Ves family protein n=1 Tax=Bradyrhizobium sp. AUGA SZCCT0169 TaxID=2807663 RepID=UPI001BAB5FB7|nr:HutD family protein [Bradyrhizobium sp. AUGA SZCCT0169]MBR1247633.1 HutD family protein [Bradyrhizobium sp. AUGA SZCCT0169]